MLNMLKQFCQRFPLKNPWPSPSAGGPLVLLRQIHVTTEDEEDRPENPFMKLRRSVGKQRDVITFLQQRIDLEPETIRNWLRNRKRLILTEDQRFSLERYESLGGELAAAHFVTARGGAVKFEDNDRWLVLDKKTGDVPFLPRRKTPGIHIEAIDLSKVHIVYEGFENLVGLKRIKYLNVSGCLFVDDWCLHRLHNFKTSLVHLDVSECPSITERGIASLHHLTNLRKLNITNTPNIAYKQLVSSQLEEELPNLFIHGVDYSPEQMKKELAEAEEIEKRRRTWQKVTDFDAGYLEARLVGMKKFENFLKYLPESGKGSWADGWFAPKMKHKEVSEW